MKPDLAAEIEEQMGIDIPDAVRTFFDSIHRVPERFRIDRDVLCSASDIVNLNRRLRKDGYYHLPWHSHFLAFGSDPGDCIYYFDLESPNLSAYFADHDLDDISDYPIIAEHPEGLISYFENLLQNSTDRDRRIQN